MGNYDDILYHTHPRSTRRSPMPIQERAAQFSPFAALTGFDAAISETGRFTDTFAEMEEQGVSLLNHQLTLLQELLPMQPEVHLICFLPDPKKSGGSYREFCGRLKKIDLYSRHIVLLDGSQIPMDFIFQISSPFINEL